MKKLTIIFIAVLVCTVFGSFLETPSHAQDSSQAPSSEKSKNTIANFSRLTGEDKLKKAKQISLEILSRQSLNRNIGTADNLRVEKVEVDDLQMAHTRVQQMVDDIPVWEGEAIVHLKSDGSLFTITDDLKESIVVNTKPKLSADDAVRIANKLYKGAAKATEKPNVTMWIYRGTDCDHLTYRVEIPRIDGSNETAIPVDFIDAQTGERVFGYDNLQTGTGSSLYSGTVTIGTSNVGSTFYMENPTRKVGTFNFNNGTSFATASDFTDIDDIWNSPVQRAAVDAQYGAEATMNYYQVVHNRNGIDGNGGPGLVPATANSSISLISSFVHYGSTDPNVVNNAAWTGSFMIYGDGDGLKYSPFVSLDICGHEFTHGVTQYTAKLNYKYESGALNESMSDIFGAMVERYIKGESANTWKIGEDINLPRGSGVADRYMNNPRQGNPSQPDNYANRLFPGDCLPNNTSDPTQNNDNCGVHINSGIANYAFYLAAKGGTANGVTVTGMNADNAAKVWYRALTVYMTSGTNFAGARTATLNAATDLFGSSSSQYNSVATGWCAVGVGSCPNGGTCPITTISIGQTINASLATTDCVLPNKGYVDQYKFSGVAGQRIAISMNSLTVDTYLYLINSSNQILSEDDDGGGGTNSRIPATSGFFTLPATGTYSIYATSFEANNVGAYSISLAIESGGQCSIASINNGQTINGLLSITDCYSTDSRYFDQYTFNGTAGQQIAISMNTANFDSFLYLVNSSNTLIASDDDDGGGTNSRIPATSGFFTLPATGSYTILASSYNANESGAYTLAVTSNCAYSLNQTNQSFPAVGGNGSTNVTTQGGCNWTAASNASWITVTSGVSGNGNGTVGFSAAANTSTSSRTGTMTIAGQTFTVTQAGQSCSYTINLTNQSFNYAGGSGSFGVSTNSGCAWQAVSNANWITANNNGTGSGNVGFSVAANPASSSRVGTISLAGNTFTVNQAGQTVVTSRKTFDFDGDGKADVSVFRPSNGSWYLQQSQNGFTGAQFGISSDKIVPADYDGDGKTDVAVYRAGVWYLNRSQLGFTGFSFGDSNDIPQPADFDGDGKAELAVFRPSNGTWYVFNLANNAFNAAQFGALNDKPVAADYDGDGKTDVAVFRPSNGTWYLLRSQLGFTGVQFGISTDLPTPADYDGDGKADVAVFRSGVWYLNRSTAGFTGVSFGAATDKPVPNAFIP